MRAVVRHESIPDAIDMVKSFDHALVVCDADDRAVFVASDLAEECHDPPSAFCIEGGGRFVGEDHLRSIRQRARNRDALLLTTGELLGKVIANPAAANTNADAFRILCSMCAPPH